MTDPRTDVKSPCIGVCALDARDVCIGCYRSAAEIGAWSALTNEEKRAVLARADRRYREEWGQVPG
jgi:hypothetical protein